MSSHTQPVLSILIVSYNTSALTIQTIASLLTDIKQSPKLQNAVEVIVIDNNSSDDSRQKVNEFLKAEAKKCLFSWSLIENTDNKGFAAANNQGALQAKGEYLLLLNSDTVVQPGALADMVEVFAGGEDASLGILAATLLNPDNTLQPQGGSLPSLPALATHMWFIDDIPGIGTVLSSTQQTHQLSLSDTRHLIYQGWVGGTALMIPSRVLKAIGPLDENIFMYGEDVEWCLRAHQAGYTVAIDTKAKVVHLQSASSSSANALIGEFMGLIYIFDKHFSSIEQSLARFILITGALFRMLLFGIMNSEKARTYQFILTKLLFEQ